MLIEVRIAQFFRQVGWLSHAGRCWDMRKKLVELRQAEGAEHRLEFLVSGRDIMAGSLTRQGRGVIGQGWQGRMAHISPGYIDSQKKSREAEGRIEWTGQCL